MSNVTVKNKLAASLSHSQHSIHSTAALSSPFYAASALLDYSINVLLQGVLFGSQISIQIK